MEHTHKRHLAFPWAWAGLIVAAVAGLLVLASLNSRRTQQPR